MKPITRTGAEVFGMVKDLKIIFGKGPGSQPVPNGADKRAPMWKKKSYFGSYPIGKSMRSAQQST